MDTMLNFNKVKCTLGQCEKIFKDINSIHNMCIDNNLKDMVCKNLYLNFAKAKQNLIAYSNQLPDFEIESIKSTDDKLDEKKISPSSENVINYKKTNIQNSSTENELVVLRWKSEISQKINEIYDRELKYVLSREIINEIYTYMTNIYGIVWEQEFKEWRRVHTGKTNKLEVIFNNATYKSIFESILADKYEKAILKSPVSIKEIINPLVNINNDKSNGGGLSLKKIYAYMEKTYNINWNKWEKNFIKQFGKYPKSKSDLLFFEHGLMERFRESAYCLMNE